nr:MAG TPA: hypothetical protein [Caudoviricetes sp.]
MRTPGHRLPPHIFPAGIFEGCVLHPGGSAIGLTTSLHRWVFCGAPPRRVSEGLVPLQKAGRSRQVYSRTARNVVYSPLD